MDDFVGIIALPDKSDFACRQLLASRHPNSRWIEEYIFRMQMGYAYFLRHKAAWMKAGLLSEDGNTLKRYLLVGLYHHFGMMSLKDVQEIEPRTDAIIWAANRYLKASVEKHGSSA